MNEINNNQEEKFIGIEDLPLGELYKLEERLNSEIIENQSKKEEIEEKLEFENANDFRQSSIYNELLILREILKYKKSQLEKTRAQIMLLKSTNI